MKLKESIMIKKILTAICIATILIPYPAFAYKRDVPSEEKTSEGQAWPQQTSEPEHKYESGGDGLLTAGYVFIALGGAAAIAGSTIAVASDKRLAGAIVGSTGAALGLTGSLMILFGSGSSGYGLAPAVDPAHGTYGLAMAAKF